MSLFDAFLAYEFCVPGGVLGEVRQAAITTQAVPPRCSERRTTILPQPRSNVQRYPRKLVPRHGRRV
jgi:hypothetical protein